MFFIVNTDLTAVQPGDTIVVTFMGALVVATFELQVKVVQSGNFIRTNFGVFQYTVQDEKYFCNVAMLNCGGVQLDV